MPTYGYRCASCGAEIERFQKMSDAPLTECESCGGVLKKILYPVGIAFKGEGFYVNDSKKSSGGSPKKPEGNSDSASGDTAKADAPAAEAKSETKTEIKTEAKPEPAAKPAG